jgi:hypothetical protein
MPRTGNLRSCRCGEARSLQPVEPQGRKLVARRRRLDVIKLTLTGAQTAPSGLAVGSLAPRHSEVLARQT